MKKLLLVLLLLKTVLSAAYQDEEMAVKVLEKVFANLEIGETIKIYSNDKGIESEFAKRKQFAIAPRCENASLLVLTDEVELDKSCKSKATFVMSYELLRKNKQSFGAFFWKKGRPNIILLKPRMQSQNISSSSALEGFVEEKIW